jgi:hypothetical protein
VVRRIEYLGHLTIDAEIATTGILDRGHRSVGKLPRSRVAAVDRVHEQVRNGRRFAGPDRHIRGGKAHAMKRSDPRRGAILVTVLWSIALLSALAMAASVTFRRFAGVMAVERDRVLGDLFGNTSNTKSRSEIIIFIKTRLIRNSVDAGAVTEEFRDRLQSMRGGRSVINGNRAQAAPGSAFPKAD